MRNGTLNNRSGALYEVQCADLFHPGEPTAWYSNRLTPEARRPMGAEIREIFDSIGLTDPFWHT
jgi:hypothetical protein